MEAGWQVSPAAALLRRLVIAVDGLLHTIASSVPRDAAFSPMLTRDVAEVSRALAALEAAAAKEGV